MQFAGSGTNGKYINQLTFLCTNVTYVFKPVKLGCHNRVL